MAEPGRYEDVDDLVALSKAGAASQIQRDWLVDLIRGRGASDRTIERVLAHVRDGLVLRRTSSRDRRSHVGGRGWLPLGQPWPRGPAGWQLVPIATLELDEMPSLDPLPDAGTLALYWDHQGYFDGDPVTSARAFWTPPNTQWHVPGDVEPDSCPFPPIPVSASLVPILGDAITLIEEEMHEDPDHDLVVDLIDDLGRELYGHQLLGAPRELQAPILEELASQLQEAPEATTARFTDDELAGEDWVLLAQIEEEPEMPIADAGILLFMIPAADLAARRFERVAVILQSH